MGKTKRKMKRKTKGKGAQSNFKLLGISLIAMGIAIAYSAFYIVTNDNNAGSSNSVFRQSSTTLLSHCAGVCNQEASNPGDIVVRYNGDIMVSGAGEWDGNDFPKEKDKSVSIPSGTYTVKLESYDNFTDRESEPVAEQSQEQYYVVFKDGSSELARTGTTRDLEDGVEEAAGITYTNNEDNTITLGSDADKITVVHAGPSSQLLKHGFEPVCMLLERVEVPTCPDGHVDAGEQCDDGNTTNGDGCSDACQIEPTCPDGHVDAGEQCDDGNTTNGDGCSSTCQIEVAPTCPDGHVDAGEQCDDGNTRNGDGCSSTCRIEEEEEEDDEDEDCDASIGNYIWYDTNGNGVQEDIEEGIEGVKVCAYNGNDKECDTTNSSGRYKIKDLCEHTYTVVVKGVDGMVQTYDPDGKKDNKTIVKLKDGDKHTKADFGYRGAAPATGLTTSIALLIGISTLITIGILMVMKKKGAL